MPSPLAHGAMGYLIYRLARPAGPEPAPNSQAGRRPWRRAGWLAPQLWLLVIFSLLPDVDAIAGVLFDDMLGLHNNGTHSLIVASVAAAVFAGLIWLWERSRFRYWFFLLFSSYSLHILMDAFTWDTRGVRLLWPLSLERFQAPFTLFYGVRWSEGLFSPQHLITLITETLFVILIVVCANWWDWRRNRRRERLAGRATPDMGQD